MILPVLSPIRNGVRKAHCTSRGVHATSGVMDRGFQVRARLARLAGVLLMLAGLGLVLQLVVLLAWQWMVAFEFRSWPELPLRLLFVDQAALNSAKLAPFLPLIPEIQWSWLRDPQALPELQAAAVWLLERIHIGMVPAILGALVALYGYSISSRQRGVLAAARQGKEDRLRRLREYRRDPAPTASA